MRGYCAWKNCKLGGKVKKGQKYKMVALDIPYFNVFFHKECFDELMKEIGIWENLKVYLAKNLELWYNRVENNGKRRKNIRK